MSNIDNYYKRDGFCSRPCENCPSRLFVAPSNLFVAMTTDEVLEMNKEAYLSRHDLDQSEVYADTYLTDTFEGRINFDVNEPLEYGAATDAAMLIINGKCTNYSDKFKKLGE